MNGFNVAQGEKVDSKKAVLMSQHTRTTLLICLAALAVVAGGFVIWWQYIEPSTARYQPLIALMENNKLPMDRPGHIDLARDFPGLTPRNEMMMTRRADGSFVAMFPTKYGEGTEVTGLMYTSRPLGPDDTYFRKNAIHPSDRLIDVGSYASLLIDERVDAHWYQVSYRIR
jgi:hypothetical protein